MKAKTYSKPVFAGKDIPAIGLDQGKGKMYHGLGTWDCYNFFYDAVLKQREGQDFILSYSDSVQAGGILKTVTYIQEGTNLHISEA